MKLKRKILKIILFVCLPLALFFMTLGSPIKDRDYGPGAYYYSDIPGWEKIFPRSPVVNDGMVGQTATALICAGGSFVFLFALKRINSEKTE